MLQDFGQANPNNHNVYYFSVEKYEYATKELKEAGEGKFCPFCNTRIEYEYYQYSHIGKFKCPNCNYGDNGIYKLATNVDLKNRTFSVDNVDYKIRFNSIYNIYNFIAVISCVSLYNIETETVQKALSTFVLNNGRLEELEINGVPTIINLAKNPTGCNVSLRILNEDDDEKELLFVLNDNLADGHDVSWIWDINFDDLNNVSRIVTAGTRAYDIAIRIKTSGFDASKIEPYLDLKEAVKNFYKTDVKKYVIANYTALQPTRKEILNLGPVQVEKKEDVSQNGQNVQKETSPNVLKILYLYPDILELYGDFGNIQVLKYRLEKRGIEAIIVPYSIGDTPPNFSDFDLVFAGGGADQEQGILSEDLLKYKESIKEAVENGVFFLLICGAYQLFGKYYKGVEGNIIPGLEVFDYYTEAINDRKKRCIGNVVINANLNNKETKVIGFENHGGQTFDVTTSFGNVLAGNGNKFGDSKEGFFANNVIATYLHGPLLSKNPELADYIIKYCLDRKYGEDIVLEPLDDNFENLCREQLLKRFLNADEK